MKQHFKVFLGAILLLVSCSEDNETGPTNTTPTIADQTFSVAEDASMGTSIGVVVASDADSDPLTYSIIDGNTDSVFSISESSGEITLAGTLDFDVLNAYSLSVEVADVEDKAMGIITVKVTEVIGKGLSDETITHDGLEREYLLYVPESYTGNTAVPLVFSLHGAGGTKESQYDLSQFDQIAEAETFILVTPQGENRMWNINSTDNRADDVGFINALIDEMDSRYNIDTDRVYVAGSSLGAFMSFQVACQLSGRIAAVAAVKGIMSPGQIDVCQSASPTAIIQMHGTEDPLVPYGGVANTLQFWVNLNQNDTTAVVTSIPDPDPNNGNTVNRHVYSNGAKGIEIEHLEVIGGVHDWFGEPGTNYDINASEEAWQFFNRFDLNGVR